MHIAVIDDSEPDREQLKQSLLSVFKEDSIACYAGAEAFLQEFVPGTVQLLFFDICMNGMRGTEAARRVRELDHRCLIVFVTSTEEFVFETFPAHPFEYLRKPYEEARLMQIIREAEQVLSEEEQTVTVRVPHGTMQVAVSGIISVTADDHLLDMHLSSGDTLECSMKFHEMETLFADIPQFLTVNRGIIINMDYTISLTGGMAHLRDGSIYPVRVREKSRLAAKFSQYMLNKMQEGAL